MRTILAIACAAFFCVGCSDDSSGKENDQPDQGTMDQGPADLAADAPAVDQTPVEPDQGSDQAVDQGPPSPWTEVKGNLPDALQAIWGRSASDIFAVGKEGLILHYDGQDWNTMFSPTSADLFGVSGTADGVTYAVGDNVILKYDGARPEGDAGVAPSWEEEYTSSWYSNVYKDVWAFSEDLVYVVGESGSVQLLDNSTWWEDDDVDTEVTLNSIVAFSETEIVVAGDNGSIFRKDSAGLWEKMETQEPSNLNALWGTAADNLYAAGLDGVVLHYDGTQWTKIDAGTDSYLYGIWGSSASDLFVVGDGVFDPSQTVLHYNGSSWDNISPSSAVGLRDIWGTSATNVYVVGRSSILHYDGTMP